MPENIAEKFKCPDCDGTALEVVMSGATVCYPIDLYKDGEFEMICGFDIDIDGATTDKFRCRRCGHTITNTTDTIITDGKDLVEWIEAEWKED